MWTLLLQPKVASHLLCPQPWLFAKGKEEGSRREGKGGRKKGKEEGRKGEREKRKDRGERWGKGRQ